ncbi:TPA: low molecular weight protein tyrosine phosphatase family protein [Burkholderia territorii]|uniref:low molecular weight protein tyrosine phosphatase family protein n=1 Tax=Burkholderia territorii TaxID=1503055 RepID=UPI0007554A55|nr:low molecular weight protein tyrosine phosphatase family protein [Burkholderia territorii]KVG60475.1 phosphotyrosine protein phosphatase [Burkholderia territorii]TXG20809.1 phosphotyrosine protein phosphatase [Burkholderia territorii]HDR8858747.1 low molecular weight protein tyrosine phosphatase family protein [Burkholderia territorii]HDR8867308.1 low molecular weight protein tyrosine phosphatase family protein [Burkholderia territorii]HDR8872747.1 low molecular weight protein tyrosine phos
MTRALFICSRNRLRSPTAEAVFAAWPGVEADSAGLAPDANTRLSAEQLEWAEIVFVMERAHKAKLLARYSTRLKHKKIVCLDIPDRYAYMQPELIALLERKAGPWLRA